MRGVLLVPPLLFTIACADAGDGDDDEIGAVDAVLALEGDVEAGVAVFAANCGDSGCHGADGDSGPRPDLSVVIPTKTDRQIVTIMMNGTGDMPALGLADQEYADVLAYVEETF